MPRHSAASVTAESVARAATTSGRAGSGSTTVNAASPFQPSSSAPPSTETMSPGAERAIAGDAVHHVVVDRDAERVPVARHELEVRSPPSPRMTRSAAASSSSGVAPGRAARRASARAAAVAAPAARIERSSAGDL